MKLQRKAGKKLYEDGYLTIFLALSITVLLSLILVLLEGARINAIRMKTETAGNIAVRSVLGEFHRELLRQYDLYFIDTSYGSGAGGVENVRQHLQDYMEKNLNSGSASAFGLNGDLTGTKLSELTVDSTRFAADDSARALREQVYAYMSADPAGGVLAEILADADTWQGLLEDGSVWEEKRKEAGEELREGLREAKEEARENHTAEERKEAREEGDDTAEEIIEKMDSFRQLPLLQQVFGDASGLSAASAGGSLLSERGIHYGNALVPENSHHYPRADEAVFDLYLGEKFGCYTAPLEKGKLKYQLEYILCGRETDRENLEKIAERLFLIRMASNCICIFSDSARQAEVEIIAALVSLVLFSPELKDLIRNALLFAWAYFETIQDLRTLFDGGRVPLHKTPEAWKSSLFGMLAPETSIQGGAEGSGLLYTEYLQGLLFLEGSSIKSMRTMDVMEMDIRQTDGNQGFCMDWCMDAFSMKAAVTSRFGYEFELTKCEGYN